MLVIGHFTFIDTIIWYYSCHMKLLTFRETETKE
uniref:Uncharacterized protein n=1 Tax=Arundo donax TaxID=35708 RepID=A0A0A9H952_ARUDO